MPYRDATPSRPAPPPPTPPCERLYLWAFVALAPWIVPATIVKDAHGHLRLSSLPTPLEPDGLLALLARLEREAPLRVTRFVRVAHTIASGEEEVWHVVVVRFRDGRAHVIASLVGLRSLDDGARVLSAVGRHRELGAVLDDEVFLGLSGMAVVFSLLPTAVWALALALLVAPLASLLVLAPLPIALVLGALARRRAGHVIPTA